MNDEYYVYAHINPISEVIFYIGKGKEKRAYTTSRRSLRWHNYVKKHGYIVKILESGLSQEKSFEREVFYIASIGRLDLGTGSLLNMSDGGVGGNNNKGRVFSAEWRRKIGVASKGKPGRMRGKTMPEETKLKIKEKLKGRPAVWLIGKKLKPEHVAKCALANKGKKRSPETIAKQKKSWELNGKPHNETIESKIRRAKDHSIKMRGSGNPMWGKKFDQQHKNNIVSGLKNSPNIKRSCIIKLTVNDEFVEEYPMLKSAAESCGVKNMNSICDCLRHRRESAYGFKWVYKSEYLKSA